MSKYTITEKVITQRSVTCYIPFQGEEQEEDGSAGGSFYTATSDYDNVVIDYLGKVRLERLPAIVELLEAAISEDTQRAEELGSHNLGMYQYDTEEEFREAVEEDVPLRVIKPKLEDMWMGSTGYAHETVKMVTSYTLMRYSNLYTLFEGPYTLFSFSYYELEGVTSLLKEFLPRETPTA